MVSRTRWGSSTACCGRSFGFFGFGGSEIGDGSATGGGVEMVKGVGGWGDSTLGMGGLSGIGEAVSREPKGKKL